MPIVYKVVFDIVLNIKWNIEIKVEKQCKKNLSFIEKTPFEYGALYMILSFTPIDFIDDKVKRDINNILYFNVLKPIKESLHAKYTS